MDAWVHGWVDGGADSLLSHCEASATTAPLGTASWPSTTKMCSQRDSDPSSAFSESFAEHFGRTKEQPTLSLEIFQIIENSWDFISRLRAFLHKVELKDVVKVQQVTECFIESGLWSTTNLSQLGRETENLS